MNLEKVDIDNLHRSLPDPVLIQNNPIKKKGKNESKIWGKMWSSNKLKKPKMVAVLYLRENGMAEPMEIESKQGFFNIYGKTYHQNRDCIWSLTKERTPLAIIPEWSLIPLGTKKWEDKSMLEKFAELQDHTLRGIRHAELVRMGDEGFSSKLSPKAIIGIIILVIIGLAVLSQYL